MTPPRVTPWSRARRESARFGRGKKAFGVEKGVVIYPRLGVGSWKEVFLGGGGGRGGGGEKAEELTCGYFLGLLVERRTNLIWIIWEHLSDTLQI